MFVTNRPQKQAGRANPLHTVIWSFRSKKPVVIIKRLLFAFNYFPVNCYQPSLQTQLINTVSAVESQQRRNACMPAVATASSFALPLKRHGATITAELYIFNRTPTNYTYERQKVIALSRSEGFSLTSSEEV